MKKTLKKISIISLVAMLFNLLPMDFIQNKAYAAEIVKVDLRVSGISDPRVGQDAMKVPVGIVGDQGLFEVDQEYRGWETPKKGVHNVWLAVPAGHKFIAGEQYRYSFIVKAKDGHSFANYENMEVLLNGSSSRYNVGWYFIGSGRKMIYVYSYPVTIDSDPRDKVYDVTLTGTIPVPEFGELPSRANLSAPSSAPYESINEYGVWQKVIKPTENTYEYVTIDDTDRFEEGIYVYSAYVTIRGENNNRAVLRAPVKAKVNGEEWRQVERLGGDFSVELDDNYSAIRIRSTFFHVKKKEYYTVSFNANGGTGRMNDVLVEKGKDYILPSSSFSAPVGKMFKGWSKDGSSGNIQVGQKVRIVDNTVFYPTWEDKNPVNTVNLTGFVVPRLNDPTTKPDLVEESGAVYKYVKVDSYWLKRETEAPYRWISYDEPTFTPGVYRYYVQNIIQGANNDTNAFEPPTKITVDGRVWRNVNTNLELSDGNVSLNRDNSMARAVSDDILIEDTNTNKVKVYFVQNGGLRRMEPVEVDKNSTFILPTPEYAPPTDKAFDAWEVAGQRKNIGDTINIGTTDVYVVALWKDSPTGENIIYYGNLRDERFENGNVTGPKASR